MADQEFLHFLDQRRQVVRAQYMAYVKIRDRMLLYAFLFLSMLIISFALRTDHYYWLWNLWSFSIFVMTFYCFYKWFSLIRRVRIAVIPGDKLHPRRALELADAEYEMVKNADA